MVVSPRASVSSVSFLFMVTFLVSLDVLNASLLKPLDYGSLGVTTALLY